MSRAIAGLGLSLAIAPALAANLIQNPDFDTDLASWITPSPPINGTSVDFTSADGFPAAGAVRVSVDATLQPNLTAIGQCISLVGTPPPWNFGGRLRIVSGAGNPVVTAAFVNGDCSIPGGSTTSSVTAGVVGTAAGVQGSFDQYDETVASDPMPGGTASQAVILSVSVSQPSGTITVDADKLYFGPAGTTPVQLTGFEVD